MAPLTWVFYATPMRSVTEDLLFDLRTRLKPSQETVDSVEIVLYGPEYRRTDGSPTFSVQHIIRDLEQSSHLERSRFLFWLFPSHQFELSDENEQRRLRQFLDAHPHVYLLTLSLHVSTANLRMVGQWASRFRDRIIPGDLLRKRSNSIVRRHPGQMFLGTEASQSFSMKLEELWTGQTKFFQDSPYVYFIAPHQIPHRSLNEAISPGTRDQVILLGSRENTDWPFQSSEPMLVNTPLKFDADTFRNGIPLIEVLANLAVNITKNEVVRAGTTVVNIAQIVLFCGVVFLAWTFGSTWGSALTALSLTGLMLVHIVLFYSYGLLLPLADTIFFAGSATLFCAVRALRSDIQSFAEQRATVYKDVEMGRLQGQYLDEFANEVESINQQLRTVSEDLLPKTELSQELKEKLQESSIEFSDFLNGIKQVASTEMNRDIELPLVLTQLRPLIAKIVSRFEKKAQQRLQVEIDETLEILTQASVMDSVLYNFISNALKYSEGKVVIYTSQSSRGKLRIGVRDEGSGIPEELQQRVFEKFYRIQDGRLHAVKGTGIGLYLSKYFAGRINGTVGVNSPPDGGSDFFVEIPLA